MHMKSKAKDLKNHAIVYGEKRRVKLMRVLKIAIAIMAILGAALASASYAMASGNSFFGATEEKAGAGDIAYLAAALSIALTGVAAAMAMGTASSAAIGAMAEKPEIFSKTLIYIVFIEAIAIYGLIVSFMILMKI